MLKNGLGDRRRQSLLERILAPHNALQGGHLNNHARRQVGFGQGRRLLRDVNVGRRESQPNAQVFDCLGNALALFQHGA